MRYFAPLAGFHENFREDAAALLNFKPETFLGAVGFPELPVLPVVPEPSVPPGLLVLPVPSGFNFGIILL